MRQKLMDQVTVCGTPSAATIFAMTVLSPCRNDFRNEE